MAIGMRSIKTAVAVFLCIIITKAFKMEYAFYAVIASVIAMEKTISNSFIVGKNRMMGTLIGAGIGFLFALIKPGDALLCGIGVIIIIYLCNLLHWNKSVSIACIVFIAIMVNLEGKNPSTYSLNRIIETLLGISIAVMINYLISPPNYIKKMYDDCCCIEIKVLNLIEQENLTQEEINISDLEKKILNLQGQLRTQENEFGLSKKETMKIENLKCVITIFINVLSHLKVIKKLISKCSLIEAVKEFEINNGEYSRAEISIILNYSVNEIKDELTSVREKLVEIGN